MKAKNTDGTWNILDEKFNLETGEIVGWRKVEDSWLDGITRRGITGITLATNGCLMVTYGTGNRSTTYGHNLVFGCWDTGIRIK